ncbi:acyl-CoA dehydrogenase family protein [Gordonia sp. ABSL11-1]|uniref:acyl-CoA dehydrogenase family protein n=1 Tax=Gordonia sp. ABSL11-1 TaxID=3053924 RepID=UPI0025739D82|nr:acyl-CoA dehydrogenase family protein [Gordonia sp. ABSL11-1]MDL9948083.1 acyl-CoA dehydrogenase family protein [Gordonia sp. ABSL11-1]
MPTHTVTNQVPPLVDHDLADQPVILEALARARADHALDDLHEIGRQAGSAEALDLADRAEVNPPALRTHDRYGNRIDEVDYDPAYHELMRRAVGFGLHGTPWAESGPNPHLVRAAKMSVWGPTDAGHLCPISMTYAVVPALRANPELASRYEPLLTTSVYEPGLRPPLAKGGLTAGMSMTEKQGGSDVRSNTTAAKPLGDGTYRITGHKWFTSAPMSDVFLLLAQAPSGLSCFFVPRVLPDGSRNPFALQRLKDKLGNRSNASSEVEYDDTVGWLVGEEGRGVPTIVEMVNLTRLDCTLGTATSMRTGVMNAAHHAAHRRAFGAALIDQPLMRNVIADLAVEAEASTVAALWLAEVTDRAVGGDARADAVRRIGLAVSKYYVCKRGPVHAAESLECLGGNGYVEESRMPRLYREAPLMSVWEGSGNVAALDVLRAIARQPETLEVFFDEVEVARGQSPALDRAVTALRGRFADVSEPTDIQFAARQIVGDMALVLQGSLLLRFGHPAVAEAFVSSRFGSLRGDVFGCLPAGLDIVTILDRVTPKVG